MSIVRQRERYLYSELTISDKLQGGSTLHGCWSLHTCQDLLGRPLESLRVAGLRVTGPAWLLLEKVTTTEDVPDGLSSLALVTDQLHRYSTVLRIERDDRPSWLLGFIKV